LDQEDEIERCFPSACFFAFKYSHLPVLLNPKNQIWTWVVVVVVNSR